MVFCYSRQNRLRHYLCIYVPMLRNKTLLTAMRESKRNDREGFALEIIDENFPELNTGVLMFNLYPKWQIKINHS